MSNNGFLATLSPQRLMAWMREPPPVVPVLRLFGPIGPRAPLSHRLNLAGLAGAIERAFSHHRSPAVALAINSPGGSPVQSALIARRIRELAEEKEKKVYAFVEDVAASGGYWLACAADEIYADANSIVGSIGVVTASFGFQDLIARYGIERRIHTAGRRKMILDPFRPERPEDVEKLRALQGDVHESFKALVRARRGDRLKADDDTVFDGEFWTGASAVGLGLIDGLGHLRPVLREKFGERVRLRVISAERGWLRRRFGMTRRPERLDVEVGGMVDGVLSALEDRALWSRYGL